MGSSLWCLRRCGQCPAKTLTLAPRQCWHGGLLFCFDSQNHAQAWGHWAHLCLAFLMSETWAMISRGVFPAPVSVTANLLSSSHQQSHLANADSSLQSKSNKLRPEELAHQTLELLCLLRRACCPLAGFLAGKLEQSWHTVCRVPSKFSLFSQSRVICQLLILALLARQICFLAKFSIVSQISRNPTWNPPVDEAKFGRLRNI